MAEKFLAHINKLMEDPLLASVPKFPNNEKVKNVNKSHKEAVDEIVSNKTPDIKYFMSLLRKKAEELKDSTNAFQNKFNALKSTNDEIAEAKALNTKKEQSLREATAVCDRLRDKYEGETRRIQDAYKARQAQYNTFFDTRKNEIE